MCLLSPGRDGFIFVVQVTRVRHVSNCSDGEDHVVID